MKRIVLAVLVSATTAAADAPKEHADFVKQLGAQLDCEGTVYAGGKPFAFTGTMHEELALDGAWIHEWLDVHVGKKTLLMDAHLAFDPTIKRWTRLELNSTGAYGVAHAAPATNGKLEWETDATGPGGKTAKGKTHIDASDPKVVKASGEASIDGKPFEKTVEMTCKKH